ncbi:hypothetical protein ACIBAI_22390 [Streptomyces sp. NPDC051041]|uniref:hypothetical protein n=1 Tax=Streptomyces sp. NPDC051041 TaxID=3365640 RepID=UPI0037B76FE0
MNFSMAAALPRSAASLQQDLEDALALAEFAARVTVAKDGRALDLTVLSSSKAPFDRTVKAATEWLKRADIEGAAAFNDAYDIVLTLPTSASVERFIEVFLEPLIRVHTTATQLDGLLDYHLVTGDALVQGPHAIELILPGDGLDAVVKLASLLGAPSIAEGLQLHDREGMRRLADRLKWLITGVVQSTARATAVPGCAHAPDHATLDLTTPQARLLAQRLAQLAQDLPAVSRPT